MSSNNFPVAISTGVLKQDDNIIIDKKIISSTVLLMKVWNDIFKSIDVKKLSEYDINNILKSNEDLLKNLNYNTLVSNLKKHLNQINFNLILN